MSIFRKQTKCPNCGEFLDKKPTRKSKCPHCSSYIFVRQGKLFTEIQVKEYDLLQRWMPALERYGVDQKTFQKERKRLNKQFGGEASVADTLWGLMNKLIAKQRDRMSLEQLYLLMTGSVKPSPFKAGI